MNMADKVADQWLSRVRVDYPDQPEEVYQGVLGWLLGHPPDRWEAFSPEQTSVAQQAIAYRYRILQQRYWGVGPEQGYRRLIQRLSGLFLIRNKISTWIALSRDRRRTVVDVVQEVVQEMMRSDRYLGQEIQRISTCTDQARLRNLLMLASLEEYCLRPIRNQPLIMYRFVNYLRRSQRGGMTQVPTGTLIRLVSDEIAPDGDDDALNLLDGEAWNQYLEGQQDLEQQVQRQQVKDSLITYLHRHLNGESVRWLELHLQGFSQEQIAQRMDLPVQQVYRLREKISYHALKIFALKEQPALVLHWLKTSLQDHSFGLTPTQWQTFWQQLSAEQQQILEYARTDQSLEEIAQHLGLKPRHVQGQWVKIYLQAQDLRA
jgi:DNA-directed RNA polymerase specialized sigma24 family protein